MGYTHYWERPAVLPRRQFLQAAQDCRRLCDLLPVPLGDAGGAGRPVFNANEICFNGHIDSGRLTSVQQREGLIWPRPGARGVAIIGSADAIAGGWGGGPAANARVLGPEATDRTRPSESSGSDCRAMHSTNQLAAGSTTSARPTTGRTTSASKAA